MLVPWLSDHGGSPLLILLVALALDAAFGDPAWLYSRAPHPVATLGRLIGKLEPRFNHADLSHEERIRSGRRFAGVLIASAFVLGGVLSLGLRSVPGPGGWLLEAVLASTLIAFRGLHAHVAAVGNGLAQDLAVGRDAVRHIVGRDPASLDEHGVARAAIESAAENLSDGVVAPVFWYLILGLPGLFAYKTINTLDSMIGHRTDRYEAFGQAAARVDDFANLPAARITGLLIALAAAVLPGADGRGALLVMWRDAGLHRSPNAGWPEAAMAGALGLSLGGPRQYEAQTVDDAWLGDGRREATPAEIRGALHVCIAAVAAMATGLLAALLS